MYGSPSSDVEVSGGSGLSAWRLGWVTVVIPALDESSGQGAACVVANGRGRSGSSSGR